LKTMAHRRLRRSARDAAAQLALEIYERIEKLHAELLRRRTKDAVPAEIDLRLRASVHSAERRQAAAAFAAQLTEQMEEEIAQRLAALSPLVPGHVYCFWCESARCEHAAPPHSRAVFAGYEPNGLPRWDEFASFCLAAKAPRVHQLHEEPPRPFTLFMHGNLLTKKQLAEFGAASTTFRILCQAVVGYFLLGGNDSARKTAVTIQAVETCAGRRAPVLALNIVGRTPSGGHLVDEVARMPDRRMAELFQKARSRIKDLGLRRTRPERERELASCIRHVAAGLEKIHRQESRRTKHARLRHLDPSRPAANALSDTARAGKGDFFNDRRRTTCIVLGPRGRTHVFNADGKHVTSMVAGGEDIERRLHTTQWVPMPDEQREALKARILGAKED